MSFSIAFLFDAVACGGITFDKNFVRQIFVLFCKDDHWQLVVVDKDQKKMHILDSALAVGHEFTTLVVVMF